ncbi:MAG: hypothetical protein R2715_10780 [Ilumatobacteraceae bacterium]
MQLARSRPIAALLLCVGLLGFVVSIDPTPSHAEFQPHPTLVPETPHLLYPLVLGTPTYAKPTPNCPGCVGYREVLAADQAGPYIVAGGNFWEVRLRDGSVRTERYFVASNADTGDSVCLGRFQFNGLVRAVEPAGTPGRVYVGGDFTTVAVGGGAPQARSKAALVDLNTCTLDPTFVPTGTNAKVNEMVLSGNRLFVGGDFTNIGGQPIRFVAELDPTTGVVRPAFQLTFGDSGEYEKIRNMGVNPGGTRLVFAGRFGTVSDGVRTNTSLTAVVDVSNPASPVLTAHRYPSPLPLYYLQDASVSPDATTVGLAYGTGTAYDYTYLVETGESLQSARWQHYMRDTSAGIAVSNNAVYVGGHFCFIDAGPGNTQLMAPRMNLDFCTGTQIGGAGAWRTHVAALSLTDGTPVAWNPGANSSFGAREMTVTSRGLLMGMDGQFVNDSLQTGALAFFDFGPQGDGQAPGLVSFSAAAWSTVSGTPVRVSGSASDNVGVSRFRVQVYSQDLRFVQANGSLSSSPFEFSATAVNGQFSLDLPVGMASGLYVVTAKAVDGAGNQSASWATTGFTLAVGDGQAPGLVSFSAAAAWSTVSGTPVRVSGSASDNVGVVAVPGAGVFAGFAVRSGEWVVVVVAVRVLGDGGEWSVLVGSAGGDVVRVVCGDVEGG